MKLLVFACCTLFSLISFAQRVKKEVAYDIVHLKDGTSIYGQLIEFNSSTGVITFIDRFERKYSLSREMYTSFEEDRIYHERVKQPDSLARARKTNEFDFGIGVSAFMAGMNTGFTPDSYYLSCNSNGMFYELPLALSLSAGKHFYQVHYLGASYELSNQMNQAGLHYHFQYDAAKTNVAKYISTSLIYQHFESIETFNVANLAVPPQTPTTLERDLPIGVSGLNLGIGHGFSFIGNNHHYWNVELLAYKSIWSKHQFDPLLSTIPNLNYSLAGAQLKCSFHF
ncbi:MAG: hypothetical protein RLZZ301_67 [Bacteroidota bacterium]|jgi:hypothetical protein